jgi:hypothetical protein
MKKNCYICGNGFDTTDNIVSAQIGLRYSIQGERDWWHEPNELECKIEEYDDINDLCSDCLENFLKYVKEQQLSHQSKVAYLEAACVKLGECIRNLRRAKRSIYSGGLTTTHIKWTI